jgi:hypothetical protein
MLNYAKNMLNYFKNTLNDAKNMLKLRLTTLNYGRGGVGYASPATYPDAGVHVSPRRTATTFSK